ncbi:MAG TPA: hypothetical protein VLH09_01215 [Bryobacteraceae bacterium]|nr:hypothetical protein [Bryobacteraceae bacterium]
MPASIREATAEVYWTAFRALSRKDRQAVLARFVRERESREDLIDLVLLEERRGEPVRPLASYLSRRSKARST